MAPLKWTSKSLKKIQEELGRAGYKASPDSISKILQEQLGYTLQGLKKTREGSSHEDRNAQFEHLNQKCKDFQDRRQPVISVDAKKEELVGDFKNTGREWQPKGQPEEMRSHDFEDKKLGKAIPLTGFTISAKIRVGSVWELIMIRLNLQSSPSVLGGTRWAD
jgi:hypothetical protein